MEKVDLPQHTKIRLGYSEIEGRGVFATDDINQGELIERCPMVPLGWRMNYHKDPVIWNYCFTQFCPCEECKNHGGHFLMVLGYGQVYNHQNENNAEIKFDMRHSIADVKAVKPIKKGEEIFVSYGKEYFNNRPYISAKNSLPPIEDASTTSA